MVARLLVRWLSGWLDSAAYCCIRAGKEQDLDIKAGWQSMERTFHDIFHILERPVLNLATAINKEAAVDQMVAECWWG